MYEVLRIPVVPVLEVQRFENLYSHVPFPCEFRIFYFRRKKILRIFQSGQHTLLRQRWRSHRSIFTFLFSCKRYSQSSLDPRLLVDEEESILYEYNTTENTRDHHTAVVLLYISYTRNTIIHYFKLEKDTEVQALWCYVK